MDPLLHVLITAALIGVIAFCASLLVKYRQGLFGSVGAGFMGMGVGIWLGGLLHVQDPLVLAISGASVPVLFTFAGALIVLLIARLIVRGRHR